MKRVLKFVLFFALSVLALVAVIGVTHPAPPAIARSLNPAPGAAVPAAPPPAIVPAPTPAIVPPKAPAPSVAERKAFAAKLEKLFRTGAPEVRVRTIDDDADGISVHMGGEECTEEIARTILRRVGAATFRSLGFDYVGCMDDGGVIKGVSVPK